MFITVSSVHIVYIIMYIHIPKLFVNCLVDFTLYTTVADPRRQMGDPNLK